MFLNFFGVWLVLTRLLKGLKGVALKRRVWLLVFVRYPFHVSFYREITSTNSIFSGTFLWHFLVHRNNSTKSALNRSTALNDIKFLIDVVSALLLLIYEREIGGKLCKREDIKIRRFLIREIICYFIITNISTLDKRHLALVLLRRVYKNQMIKTFF